MPFAFMSVFNRMLRLTALGLSLMTMACSDGAMRDDEGNVVDAGDVAATDLRVGDCFDDDDNPDGEFESLGVVPCSEPHDNEIFALLIHPETTAPYPGIEAMYEFAVPECVGAFEEFVGHDYVSSDLDFDLIYPIESGWEDDSDREILCFLWQVDLAKLEGSMEGSGR